MTNFNKMIDDMNLRKTEGESRNETPRALVSRETVPAELHMIGMGRELSTGEQRNLMKMSGGKEQK